MMPQTVTVTFMLVWLMNHHGWPVATAGILVIVSQLLGALGRIAVGRWSDRVGSRMRPVRVIAIASLPPCSCSRSSTTRAPGMTSY